MDGSAGDTSIAHIFLTRLGRDTKSYAFVGWDRMLRDGNAGIPESRRELGRSDKPRPENSRPDMDMV